MSATNTTEYEDALPYQQRMTDIFRSALGTAVPDLVVTDELQQSTQAMRTLMSIVFGSPLFHQSCGYPLPPAEIRNSEASDIWTKENLLKTAIHFAICSLQWARSILPSEPHLEARDATEELLRLAFGALTDASCFAMILRDRSEPDQALPGTDWRACLQRKLEVLQYYRENGGLAMKFEPVHTTPREDCVQNEQKTAEPQDIPLLQLQHSVEEPRTPKLPLHLLEHNPDRTPSSSSRAATEGSNSSPGPFDFDEPAALQACERQTAHSSLPSPPLTAARQKRPVMNTPPGSPLYKKSRI